MSARLHVILVVIARIFSPLDKLAMATDFMAKFGYIRLFSRATFENCLQYRHSDLNTFSGNILATFYAI